MESAPHADGQLVDWLFTHRFDPLDSGRGPVGRSDLEVGPCSIAGGEKKVTIVDKAGSLMRPVVDRLRAYDKIEIVDRARSASGDVVLLAPRGNLQDLPKIRSEMSNANIQLVMVTAKQKYPIYRRTEYV